MTRSDLQDGTLDSPRPMPLMLTEDEEALRSAVRNLVTKHAPWQDVLQGIASGRATDQELWKRLATDMGVAGLAIPEQFGGHGASWREASVVATELGRAVAPVPFLSSSVLATAVLLEIGAHDVLSQLAGGDLVVACAIAFVAGPGDDVSSAVRADGDTLVGSVRAVADASVAHRLLVPTDDGLYLVDRDEVDVRQVPSFDPTRPLSDLVFAASRGHQLADRAASDLAVERALQVGSALLACELVGVAEAALDTVVEYLKHRVQFGRVVGSYQALKHQLADGWMMLEQAASAARYAACCVATQDPDQALAAATAKAFASEAAVTITERALQLHGGIGFTWENSPHLFLKRAKADSVGLGSRGHHLAIVGDLVGLTYP